MSTWEKTGAQALGVTMDRTREITHTEKVSQKKRKAVLLCCVRVIAQANVHVGF